MNELTRFLADAGLKRESELRWIEPVETQLTYDRMWNSPLGTYEATIPDDPRHVEVAVRLTATIKGSVLGDYPDLGRRILVSDAQPRTEIQLTAVGPWQFHETHLSDAVASIDTTEEADRG